MLFQARVGGQKLFQELQQGVPGDKPFPPGVAQGFQDLFPRLLGDKTGLDRKSVV